MFIYLREHDHTYRKRPRRAGEGGADAPPLPEITPDMIAAGAEVAWGLVPNLSPTSAEELAEAVLKSAFAARPLEN